MLGYTVAWTAGGTLRLIATLEMDDLSTTDFGRPDVFNWSTATYRTTRATVISLVDAFDEEHLEGYTDSDVHLRTGRTVETEVDFVVDEEVLVSHLLEPDVLAKFPYADFLLDGEWCSYHRDGHPRVRLRYKNGQPCGTQYIYKEDHSVLRCTSEDYTT